MRHVITIGSSAQHIRERIPFRAGNLSAVDTGGGWIGEGWLYSYAKRWAAELDERREHIRYVIYSYATPIAWWDDELGWAFPDIRFSPSTGNHQRAVRSALNPSWYWDGEQLHKRDDGTDYRTTPLGVLRDAYFTFDGDVSDETRQYLTLSGSLSQIGA
jgi:hypothetical protein